MDLDPGGVYPSMFVDYGIVFPIIDAGALITRAYPSMKIEDFVPCFYVKTLFHEIFNPLGIKLQGDFIDDSTYKKLIVASNGRSQDDIDARSTYAKNTSSQAITGIDQVLFQEESVFPYFDGSQNNFVSSSYTADVRMAIKLSFSIPVGATGIGSISTKIRVRVNGSSVKTYTKTDLAASNYILNKELRLTLEAGDVLEIAADQDSSLTMNVQEGATIKITPVFLYRIFGKSSVPNWTQGEFVSNILRLFNVLPSYNTKTKTLTLDLFNNIKQKEYVDISSEIVINEIDFSELVSNYAKNNIFKYEESDEEDLREYNISNFISYGSGILTVDNDCIENYADIVESDFTSPITYLNGTFDMSMERINFVRLAEEVTRAITSVTDSSGTARFNITNADDYFAEDDLVRIDTDVDTYNGDWVVDSVTSSYITVKGGTFDASTTGEITLLRHEFTTDDNVYLFINIPGVEVDEVSSIEAITIDDSSDLTGFGIAYFNLLSNGRPINNIYKQSLSFGSVNNPLSYQRSLLDTYWPLFSSILNSPVSIIADAYFKRTTFDNIKTFLRPVRVETQETTNLYYINRLTGYKGGGRPSEIELIKLN